MNLKPLLLVNKTATKEEIVSDSIYNHCLETERGMMVTRDWWEDTELRTMQFWGWTGVIVVQSVNVLHSTKLYYQQSVLCTFYDYNKA